MFTCITTIYNDLMWNLFLCLQTINKNGSFCLKPTLFICLLRFFNCKMKYLKSLDIGYVYFYILFLILHINENNWTMKMSFFLRINWENKTFVIFEFSQSRKRYSWNRKEAFRNIVCNPFTFIIEIDISYTNVLIWILLGTNILN